MIIYVTLLLINVYDYYNNIFRFLKYLLSFLNIYIYITTNVHTIDSLKSQKIKKKSDEYMDKPKVNIKHCRIFLRIITNQKVNILLKSKKLMIFVNKVI